MEIISQRDMLGMLGRSPISLKPLVFKPAPVPSSEVDVAYDIDWEGKGGYRFLAEATNRTTPQAFAVAAQRAKSHVFDARGTFPLVIVPYLSPSNLADAERFGISAVDLCGNGVIQVPQQWLVVRAGMPNRFRASSPLATAYRGVASLVARAFVAQSHFAKVSDVQRRIEVGGSRITLPTVSKALKRLEADLVIARDADGLRVLQADKLLESLKESYRPPRIRSKLSLKARLTETGLHRALAQAARDTSGRIVLTGISSARVQTIMALEPVTSFYCSMRPEELARAASIDATQERHFPDLELLETDDERVFFDAWGVDGRQLASPVQTWLELATGDKRTREVASSLRQRILKGMEGTGDA